MLFFERTQFNRRCQLSGKSAKQYIVELYNMVEHCNYGDLKSEMIQDHHIVGILSKFLFERLKLNLDLTLEKAKKMVCHCEAVQEQQQVLSGDVVSSLNKVRPSHPGSKKHKGKAENIIKSQRNRTSQASKTVHAVVRNPTQSKMSC